jgi:hypothetical protein
LKRHLPVLLAFASLSVYWTWPIAADISSRVPHDLGDPLLNIWILWWNAHAVPLTTDWWNPPMMWPVPGAMALSEHLLGLSLFTTPLQLAGASPIAAYNVYLLLTYALSGFFAYLLVRRLTGSSIAAICAGLAFGFSPYRASQLSHVQVLAAEWMPLALLGMHAYLSTGRVAWLAVFGIAWLLQALSNGYFLLFFPILIALWLAWFVNWRMQWRRGCALTSAFAIASLPLVPILWKYHAVHGALGLRRSVAEIRDFSGVPASFLHAAPLMKVWTEGKAPHYETYLFPGIAVMALALAGVLLAFRESRRPIADRSPTLFYAAAALLMAALTLGPGGQGNDPPSMVYPYSWLLWLPGFDGLRVPARFAMLATLCLAIASGLGAARLVPIAGRWRMLVGALALAGVAADGLTEPVPMLSPPGKMILPLERVAVVELPLDDIYVGVAAMYRSMFYRQPLVNGYSGHFPPHYNVLSLSLARGDTSGLIYFARRRPLVIVVNDNHDPGHGYRKMVESIPAVQSLGISAGGSTFLVPAQAEPRVPPVGAPLGAEVRDAGRFLIEYDLGASKSLGAVDISLGRRYDDFAAHLRIEVSDDGSAWREAWSGWTGGLAVEATLADPWRAPIRIPIFGERARYVRIYPASSWMKTDVKVIGADP